jgi:hypothetical protein
MSAMKPFFSRLRRVLTVTSLLVAGHALAVEGMWQPWQMPSLEKQVKQAGFELPIEAISNLDKHPMTAVVSLGFCSASFVSPQGLIVTNHHCAYGAIQYNSTDKNNLIEKGFYAEKLGDELPGGPGLYVYVTEDIKDVTEAMLKPAEGLHGLARFDALEGVEKQLIKQCESEEATRCRVATFHGGLKYYLIKQREIKDVRLVYAPADSIGKFGGDIDNWMWPRHTGDFSFLRAYVSPEGKSVEYNKDNVPYTPKSFLEVNPKGLQEGDFAMVLGYPGRTSRHRLAEEIENAVNWHYPMVINHYKKAVEIIEEKTKGRPDAAVKYASYVAGINNYTKNSEGMLDGFKDTAPIEAKKQKEADFKQWAQKHHKQQALDSLDRLQQLLAESRQHRDRDFFLGMFQRGSMLSAANRLYRLADEKQKPDAERDPAYQQRNWDRIRNRLVRIDRSYDPVVDQALAQYALENYAALPAAERIPALDKWFGIKGDSKDSRRIAKKLKKMYAKTSLGDKQQRLSLLEATPEQLNTSSDSFMQLAKTLYPWRMAKEKHDKALSADIQEARKNYMAALLEYSREKGEPVYADANSTLRITFGTVQGYSPRDAVWYEPFTTLRGILEKYTGKPPFDAPQKEIELIKKRDFGPYYDKKLDSVPVNFLTDLDITGGNSGSPTLDARARLVGLAFDGNYESINADWIFNPKLARTIHVDIRYMLWIMDKVDNAQRLLREMKVKH